MDEIFPDMRPGQSLDDYIEKSLRPTQQEFSRFHAAVDLFVRFLQKTFSDSTYSVAKVLKSGSLAKGTALRDSSDVDLVVFINGLTDIDDLMVAREALKRRMIAAAETYPSSLKTKKSTKFAAKFAFNNIELDVLPAFDALRSYSRKRRNIYRAISQHLLSSKRIGQEFSASLAPLQVAFIKTLRCSVKDYIRLMKQWKKVNDLTIPSYCLELLTVKVWRDMGGSKKRQRPASTFNIFKRIIDQLADFDNIRVAFGGNYKVEEYIKSWKVPYIMDPANPHLDTLSRLDEVQRKEIQAAARETRDLLKDMLSA